MPTKVSKVAVDASAALVDSVAPDESKRPMNPEELTAWQASFECEMGCHIHRQHYFLSGRAGLSRDRERKAKAILEEIGEFVDYDDICILGMALDLLKTVRGEPITEPLDDGDFIASLMAVLNDDESKVRAAIEQPVLT